MVSKACTLLPGLRCKRVLVLVSDSKKALIKNQGLFSLNPYQITAQCLNLLLTDNNFSSLFEQANIFYATTLLLLFAIVYPLLFFY